MDGRSVLVLGNILLSERLDDHGRSFLAFLALKVDFLWEPTKSKSNVNSETYENERWCQFSGSYLKEQFRLEKGLKLDPDKKRCKKVLGFGNQMVRKGNNEKFRL